MTDYFIKDGDDFKKVENFSKEQIDEIADGTDWLTKRLERERSKVPADYEDLKKKVGEIDTIKSEYETKLGEANTKNEDLTKQFGKAQLDTEKVKIVHEFKLSDELSEFVTGDNADEMRTRAEKLSKGIKPSNIHIDKKDKPEGKDTDSKRIAGELFGRKKD